MAGWLWNVHCDLMQFPIFICCWKDDVFKVAIDTLVELHDDKA